MNKSYRYLTAIGIFFVAVLLISNVASTKIVDLKWFVFDAGTLLFPLSYIFGDILTEVYGYKKSRSIIWLGFLSALLMSLVFIIVGALPPASDWPYQEAYQQILGLTPRIVLASLVAYLVGEFLNSYTLAKLKVKTQGRHLWARFLGSTVVGQLADTVIFVLIAFTGIFPQTLLVTIIISNYIFKLAIEVVLLPATYKATTWLKRKENEDYYDSSTNFNPFAFIRRR